MYAQIIDGKINPIVINPEKVEEIRANGVEIIDFTKAETKPQAGWLWDGEKAYAPVEPEKTPVITVEDRLKAIEAKLEKLATIETKIDSMKATVEGKA